MGRDDVTPIIRTCLTLCNYGLCGCFGRPSSRATFLNFNENDPDACSVHNLHDEVSGGRVLVGDSSADWTNQRNHEWVPRVDAGIMYSSFQKTGWSPIKEGRVPQVRVRFLDANLGFTYLERKNGRRQL